MKFTTFWWNSMKFTTFFDEILSFLMIFSVFGPGGVPVVGPGGVPVVGPGGVPVVQWGTGQWCSGVQASGAVGTGQWCSSVPGPVPQGARYHTTSPYRTHYPGYYHPCHHCSVCAAPVYTTSSSSGRQCARLLCWSTYRVVTFLILWTPKIH